MLKITQNKIMAQVVILVLLVLFVLLFTYPLVLNLDQLLLGGEGDNLYFVWQSWWLKQTLTNPSTFSFHTNYFFYPHTLNLWQSFHGIFATFLASLLQFIASPILAYNLVVILLLALSAFTTYLLVKYLVKSYLIAFFGGIMMAFSPFLYTRAFGHLSILTFCWTPLAILYLLKFYDQPKKKYLLLLTLFFILNAYSDWYNLVILSLFLLVFVLVKFLTDRINFSQKIRIKDIILFLILVVIFVGPIIFLFLSANQETASITKDVQLNFVYNRGSADLLSYFIPPSNLLLSNQYTDKIFNNIQSVEQSNFLGYLEIFLLFLFIFRFKKDKNDFLWIIIFLVFIYISFGTRLIILNFELFKTPYYFLVNYWPALAVFRVPVRFSSLVTLATVIMSTLTLKKILNLKFFQKKIILILFSALIFSILLLERYQFPVVITKISPPANFYNRLAQEAGNFALIELPYLLGFNNIYNYHQIFHRQRLVLSRINYNSYTNEMIDFYLKNFIYQNYNCLEFQPKDPVPVKEKIKFFQNNKIKYVILNKDKILNKSCRFMREYWQENYAPYLYYEDRDIIAYKTY